MNCRTEGCSVDVTHVSFYFGKTGPLCRKCFEELEGLAQHAARPRKRGFWGRLFAIFS